MKLKYIGKLLLLVLLCSFFIENWIVKDVEMSRMQRLDESTVTKMEFRDQEIGEEMLTYLVSQDDRGMKVGIYLLESNFGYQKFAYPYKTNTFEKLIQKWKKQKGWINYIQTTEAIWRDVKYFPVPVSTTDKKATVAFENGWMSERTYGGERGHEGTDLMAAKNIRGLYPIVSITDGVVDKKGWLDKGGYRIGVKAPAGGYFYYAHLDSYANLEVGDKVKAGDILGFMGDSGYGVEGTMGKFPVHLHLGIYVYPNGEEMSVNPYWVLRYLENYKLKYAYSE